ncbi:MAG: hypothetical protein ABSF26_00295 [Thermoguttaceae bacterium]|jgi:hypothetical protein
MCGPRIICKTIPGFAGQTRDSRLWKLAAVAWCVLCPALPAARSADAAAAPPGAEKYLLRYRFRPGEILCWNVVHCCQIRTVAAGSEQTADTATASVKVWRVQAVRPDGAATLEHSVKDIDMRHRLTGRDEVHYNSRTDLHAPPGFEDIARAVGVPLCTVTIDAQGKVLARQQNPVKAAVPGHGEITVRLPKEPIAVGQSWSFPSDIELPRPQGGVRRIEARQSFTLQSVKTGVAVIRMATQILTPVHDPALQSQLLQYEAAGTARLDIEAGRLLAQQSDVDKGVVGFRGEASSIHYRSRSTEEFLPAEARVAARAAAGN